MTNSLLITLTAVFALVAGFMAKQLSTTPNPQETGQLPDFTLPDLAGEPRNISEWKGKVLVINFWATWCPPCLREIPEFIALQNEFGSQGLQFIGIAVEEKEPVEAYVQTVNLNYPVLIGEEAGIALSQKLGNKANAVPFTIIVDPSGKIIHQHPGEFKKQQITELIAQLI